MPHPDPATRTDADVRNAKSPRRISGGRDPDFVRATRSEAKKLLAVLAAEMAGYEEPETSWRAIDLRPLLFGERQRPRPTVLAGPTINGEKVLLLYSGRVHSVYAETEGGKTWMAMEGCRQEIEAGGTVLFIDFEDDEDGTVDRLLSLGLTPDQIVNQFRYVRPQEPFGADAIAEVEFEVQTYAPTLVVIDGVTEALRLDGLDSSNNDDVVRFLRVLPRRLAEMGPAVLLIDHVVKDAQNRGRGPIGGGMKLNGLTGAAYYLKIVAPFGRGKTGYSKLFVQKDRPGFVNKYTTDKNGSLGIVQFVSGEADSMAVRFVQSDGPASTGDGCPDPELAQRICAFLQQHEGSSQQQVKDAFKGDAFDRGGTAGTARVTTALGWLVDNGHLDRGREVEGKSNAYRCLDPFKDPS